jgi:hypothetical protein
MSCGELYRIYRTRRGLKLAIIAKLAIEDIH